MTSWRWKSRSGRARRPSSPRPSTLSASARTAAPLWVMPAASSCSCTRRAYGSGAPYRIAIRSSGTPSRTASITRRTTARTSSSGSDADTTRVAAGSATPTSGTVTPIRASASRTGASARSHPVSPATTVTGTRSPSALHERGGGCGHLLGEVEHHGAEVVEQRHPGADGVDRGVHQVALVVPLGRQRGPRPSRDPHDVGGAPPRAHERIERGVVDRRQLAVGVDERGLGRGVVGDRAEDPRCRRQHRAHGRGEHRGGHRAPVRAREAGCTQQLGQPVRGEERHSGDTVAAGRDPPQRPARQQPTRRDADVVGGHHHRDRRQRVAALGRHDRVEQRAGRRLTVGNGQDVDRHRPGSYGGGHAACGPARRGGRPICWRCWGVRSSRWTLWRSPGWLGLPTRA